VSLSFFARLLFVARSWSSCMPASVTADAVAPRISAQGGSQRTVVLCFGADTLLVSLCRRFLRCSTREPTR
jgi:hypothetical protein